MRSMMWIYAVMILLVSEAWSVDAVVMNLTFNLGSEVNLTCSNKTWSEMLFVIWNIELTNKQCKIAFNNDGGNNDSCNDGKSLRNTSSALSYLHIPKFQNADVGVYKCESVYTGGNDNYAIHVAIAVPPTLSAWLERKGDKMVAVCKAEKGKPAANISWSHIGNSSSVKTASSGFFTVESRLELLEGMDPENLSCTVRHPSWKGEKILVPKPERGQAFAETIEKSYVPWLCTLAAVICVFLAGFLFFAQKKLIMSRRCQQSQTSPTKPPPTEDVEEVEPYASYVQRVNSIYNSSADLFT